MTESKTPKPGISILVPVYNVEKYLGQCLDSLCAQRMQELEFICINDGSTDGSLALLREYAARDARITIIDKENSGYGASMNRGLEAASGEYVGILESDDFVDPEAFEVLYSAAKDNEADVVKGNFFFHWSDPQPRDEFEALISKDMVGTFSPLEQLQIFFAKPTIWSAIYRRGFLEENAIGFLESPGASYQDASFNFKVWACAKRVTFLEQAFFHYRQDNEASSVNSPGKVYCVCDEYAEMQRFLDGRPKEKALLQGVLVRMKYASYMWNSERIYEAYRADFLQRASSELAADLHSGRLDLGLFEFWTESDLRALIKSPQTFEHYLSRRNKPGKLNTFRRYFSTGGWPLVRRALRERGA
ncbi:MAG: glycosyltransferase [Eggerthellaceae bacterium]|nr:glycosyltransferase [Eggerthellaceae bacterium]